jgi:hypothetical protein
MAYNRATGLRYISFLNRVHRRNLVDWYLEIGCRSGASAKECGSKTIMVDPFFKIETNIIRMKPRLHVFQQESDAFFETGFLKATKTKISFAFLDGLHLFEFLLRDFMNTERNSLVNGIVAIHDCCPSDLKMTTRDPQNLPPKSAWTGDVWKLIPILQEYRTDLKIEVLDCLPTGLVIVSNLAPGNTILQDNYDEILARYIDKTIEDFGTSRYYDSFSYIDPKSVLKDGCRFLDKVRLSNNDLQKPAFVSPKLL